MKNSNHHASSVYDSMAPVTCSPEYNPQTILDYLSCGVQRGRCTNPHVKDLMMKARRHLSAIGWTFFYVFKKTGTRELRYKSPNDKVYPSMRTACEWAVKNQLDSFDEMGGSKIYGFKKSKRKSESFSCVDRPQKKVRIEDVKTLCIDQKIDKRSSVVQSEFKKERYDGDKPMKQIQDVKRLMLTGKKVAQKDKVSFTKKRGVLGLLIENNIVKRGARVSYLGKKDGKVLKRGRVYEDGIKCDCCDEMFLLTNFETHAGSTNHRPAANIFFDDNRSILDCETQLEHEIVLPAHDKSMTNVCRLCHQGQPNNLSSEGDSQDHDLIKCVQCERHFHLSCISKLGFVVCVDDPAKWLCTDNCESIYLGRSYGVKVEM